MSPPIDEESVTERLLNLFQKSLEDNKSAYRTMNEDLKEEIKALGSNVQDLSSSVNSLNEKVVDISTLYNGLSSKLIMGFVLLSFLVAGISGAKIYLDFKNKTFESNSEVQMEEQTHKH